MPDLKEKPEKDETSTQTVSEIKEPTESDVFTADERQDIIKMVRDDVAYGESVQKSYVAQKILDLQHYHCRPPSELENLTKKPWMADRNLGLARAIADSFQSTYLATAWTPDSINFIATNALEIDNRNNQERFTKWGMGKQEADMQPQVDAFIHNQIVVGSAFYKIYRKTWWEWVDKRIPVKNKAGKTTKYEIKTERVKFVKGVIENIPDIDDILMPEYGKNIQELPFFIQNLHIDGETVLAKLKNKDFKPLNAEEYKKKLLSHAYKEKERELGAQKLKDLGIDENSMTTLDVRRLSIDLYEWYGLFTKNNKTEKYRFIVDLRSEEVLSGKPLRKINRSGKIPFVGGSLWAEPGQIRGVSLMQIIAPVVNAFNNVFNQKTDFQFVTNCPFGFYKPDEGYTEQKYELEPMVCYPTDDPTKINFPNLSRSMAWAESDMRILFEVLERLTGAASYFQSRSNQSNTLGQDQMIAQNSDTRFGLGVSRIMGFDCEAIGMWFELYQDYPPKGLAERIVGVDGEKLLPNLSIDSLRGDTSVQMTPDVVSGSKQFRKQLQIETYGVASQMLWLNPQVNPTGNWELCADTLKEIRNYSDNDIVRYLGEKPKLKFNKEELDDEWYRFMNGEDFDPPEGESALALEHLQGHMKQKEEKYNLLAEEYRPNFDAHLFKTTVNYMKFLKNAQKEQMATMLASQMILSGQAQPPQQGQVVQPGAPQAQPGGIPGAMPAQPPMPGQPLTPEQPIGGM